MVLQSTGAISFGNIQTEFGGTNPINLSEYYQNNASGYTNGVSGIPNTLSQIKLSNFYGKSKRTNIANDNTPPSPVSTVFTGTYVWVGGSTTTHEWITGCSSDNLSRTDVSKFNNIWSQGQYRAGVIYYPELILQARAEETISFSVHINTTGPDYEHIRAWINLGAGYYQIGDLWTYGSSQLNVNYQIPQGTPAGNYALCGMNDYGYGDGSYRSVNYYSLQIW
jgi:hypothetical protein